MSVTARIIVRVGVISPLLKCRGMRMFMRFCSSLGPRVGKCTYSFRVYSM